MKYAVVTGGTSGMGLESAKSSLVKDIMYLQLT